MPCAPKALPPLHLLHGRTAGQGGQERSTAACVAPRETMAAAIFVGLRLRPRTHVSRLCPWRTSTPSGVAQPAAEPECAAALGRRRWPGLVPVLSPFRLFVPLLHHSVFASSLFLYVPCIRLGFACFRQTSRSLSPAPPTAWLELQFPLNQICGCVTAGLFENENGVARACN